MKDTKFSSKQRLIAILCFFAYTFAYLIRINISIALPDITSELNLSTMESGGITSAFFWVYAMGQLISGWLGDRISPKYMISVGIFVSAILNISLSFAKSAVVMAVLWGINGIFQSMLWAPIMKTIVIHFEGERRKKMTFIMSLTLVFGYCISWSASTLIKNYIGWRAVFVVPAILAMGFVAIWFVFYPKKSLEKGNVNVYKLKSDTLGMLKAKYALPLLVFIVILSIVHGIIKESINVWLPTMMSSVGSFSLSSTLGILVVVPVINFAGIFLMKTLMSKGNSNAYSVLSRLFIISFAVSVITVAVSGFSPYALIAMTIAMSGLMFSINPILTAFVPIDFDNWNCVATIAGFVDCTIYIGAALSGILTGALVDGSNWSSVTLMWSTVLIIGTIAAFIALKISKKFFIHMK